MSREWIQTPLRLADSQTSQLPQCPLRCFQATPGVRKAQPQIQVPQTGGIGL
jgi:hypothetical protein